MEKLLDKINSPTDLKKLKLEELPSLAEEIREMIISTVSKTGGHLGASLGTVELTLVLHYVLNTPEDKIVWDVGHQAYTHKIITGRKDKFFTLRQFGGISGFPNRDESEYDSFSVGHAATAVSAALGMAVARDLEGKSNKVVAVIGDGSLSCGLTYEALNNAGHLGTDLIVILNDNAMFISPRVGAISKMLVRILTLGLVRNIERCVENFLRRLSYVGNYFLRVAKRFKVLFFPGMLFEEMGFAYLGPIDGHDIKELYRVIKDVKNFKGPILVHIITKKGKGFAPAEKKPDKYHGVGKFDIETGEFIKDSRRTFTKTFSEAIISLAKRNQKIVAVTAAMTDGCGLEDFYRIFPNRFFDVGIAEGHAVTFSAGLATQGFVPICAIYSSFLQRSFDQIIHDVALPNLHVIFAIDRAGLVGEDGATHHGSFDLSYLRLIPNLTILVPKDGRELVKMLNTAVDLKGPVAIRYPRNIVPDEDIFTTADNYEGKILLEEEDVVVDISNVEIVILATGPLVYVAKEVSKLLGCKIGVVNFRVIKPLNEKLLKSVGAKKVVTIEDNTIIGGVYSAVCEFYQRERIDKEILGISLPDRFVPHGDIILLQKSVGLDTESIVEKINTFFSKD